MPGAESRRCVAGRGSPVRRHPLTGLACLWTLPMHLEGYAGMGEEASRALLERIMLPGASGDAVLEHVCA